MKRALTLLLAILLLLPAIPAAAENEGADPALSGLTAYALYECATGTCLIEKNAGTAYPVAGLSKLPALLTLCAAFDEGSILDTTEVPVSHRAASVSGPTAFLSEGESAAAGDLLRAAVMISAGDAITSLYENICGSESMFLENIHVTIREAEAAAVLDDALGANLLLSPEQLFRLGRAAAKSSSFLKNSCLFLDSLTHEDGRVTELVNANRMVRFYTGCDGLLTGSSPESGYAGVFHASRNGMELIAVVIGAGSSLKRSSAAELLFNFGFSNYTVKALAKENGVVIPAVSVHGGDIKTVNLISKEPVFALQPKSAAKLTEERDVPTLLEAPISTDTPVGEIRYLDESGAKAAVITLYADQSVERFGLIDILRKILRDFSR